MNKYQFFSDLLRRALLSRSLNLLNCVLLLRGHLLSHLHEIVVREVWKGPATTLVKSLLNLKAQMLTKSSNHLLSNLLCCRNLHLRGRLCLGGSLDLGGVCGLLLLGGDLAHLEKVPVQCQTDFDIDIDTDLDPLFGIHYPPHSPPPRRAPLWRLPPRQPPPRRRSLKITTNHRSKDWQENNSQKWAPGRLGALCRPLC